MPYSNTDALTLGAVRSSSLTPPIRKREKAYRVLDRARAQGVHEVILLTETAPTYFPRFGFEPVTRAEAPEAVTASVEFKGACCATAAVMRLRLG